MKKYFLLLLILFPLLCFAQNDAAKREYKWGVGVQMNQIRRISLLDDFLTNINYGDGMTRDKSYSIGVTSYYFLSENFGFRIRVDKTKTNINVFSKQPVILSTSNVDLLQENYEIALGCLWEYTKDRICFGGGLEIPFGVYGDFIMGSSGENYTNGILTYISKSKIMIPGGSSFGIGGFVNLNFNFLKNISVGFQISSALINYKIGGDTSEEAWVYDANGVLSGYTIFTRITTYEQFSVLSPIASINLLFKF